MSIRYVVEQGDCLSSIAERHGVWWETVWKHADNEGLREKRGTPSVLLPGDVVAIPDELPKVYKIATGKTHRFVAKSNVTKIRIRFQVNGKAIEEGEPYELYVDEATEPVRGKLKSSGELEEKVPAEANSVTVLLKNRKIGQRFMLGHLDPADTPTGAQARLRQLGFYHGAVDGKLGPLTLAALRGFQKAQNLTPSEELDDATVSALKKAYGN